MTKELFPYQRAAVENFDTWHCAATSEGAEREALIAMTVGLGKTFTAAACCKRVVNCGGSILWVTHRDELIRQSSRELTEITGIECGIIQGAATAAAGAKIVVASVMSLHARRLKRLVDGMRPSLIVFDEAHHSPAPTWARIKHAYEGVPVLNLTATPYRMDVRERLNLGRILAQMDISDGIKLGRLVPPRAIATIEICFNDMKVKMGDFTAESASALMMENKIMERVVAGIVGNLRGHRGIIFSATVGHGREVASRLMAEGFRIGEVYGTTPVEDRQKIYRGVEEGSVDAIVNNLVCTEGFNMPCLDFGAILRPTKNASLYIQMLGRILRANSNKKEALLLDVVDAPKKKTGAGLTLPSDSDVKKFAAMAGHHYPKATVFMSWFRRADEIAKQTPIQETSKLNTSARLAAALGVDVNKLPRSIEYVYRRGAQPAPGDPDGYQAIVAATGAGNIDTVAKRLRASGWGYYPRLNIPAQGAAIDEDDAWGELGAPTGYEAILVHEPQLRHFLTDILGTSKNIVEQAKGLYEVRSHDGEPAIWLKPYRPDMRDAFLYFPAETCLFFVDYNEIRRYDKRMKRITPATAGEAAASMPEHYRSERWVGQPATDAQVAALAKALATEAKSLDRQRISRLGASCILTGKYNEEHLDRIHKWLIACRNQPTAESVPPE